LDHYETALVDLINRKRSGKPITPKERPAAVRTLMKPMVLLFALCNFGLFCGHASLFSWLPQIVFFGPLLTRPDWAAPLWWSDGSSRIVMASSGGLRPTAESAANAVIMIASSRILRKVPSPGVP
jgi:hypothetical protein